MTDHQFMLEVLKPFIENLDKNNFSYVICIGKNQISSRYMKGQYDDIVGMLTGLAEKNKQFNAVLKDSIVENENKK